MQANLTTFLTGAAPSGQGSTTDAKSGGGSDLFSQMLGDAAMQGGGKQQANQLLKTSDISASALLAQEMNQDQALNLGASAEQLSKLLGEEIGPEEARALLDQMAEMQDQAFSDQPEFAQLQEALEQIEESGETMDVASLLDSLPVAEEAASPAERAPLMQRMLNWMHGAIERHKEGAPQLAQPAVDGTAASLQASLFPAGHDALEATQAAPAETAVKPATEETPVNTAVPEVTTVIVPLVQQQQLQSIPAWVRNLGNEDSTADAAIDEAIPSLAMPAADDSELPEVRLPGAPEPLPKADVAAAKQAPAFMEHLKPLNAALADAEAVSTPVVEPTVAPASLHAQNSLQQTHALSNTHNVTAQGQGYVNHAPVSEQVHVAITQATNDGIDQITLQLEPADLGRVEVKMDIAPDGKTHLSFVVDKADTLDALSRDARSLERQLQEAGIKADAGTMQFNLRQQPQNQFGDAGGESGNGQHAANDNQRDGAATVAAAEGVTTHYTINVREGVDIRA